MRIMIMRMILAQLKGFSFGVHELTIVNSYESMIKEIRGLVSST